MDGGMLEVKANLEFIEKGQPYYVSVELIELVEFDKDLTSTIV
jgi:hypothetical protein